jgi:Cdc6-like AAA superfamily ATPase
MAPKMSLADWSAKRFEANQLFTPSTPVTVADLFAGRRDQIFRIIDSIGERSRHILLYGERGVGKTSLTQIVPYLIPSKPEFIKFCRVQCFPTDNYSSICKKIFKDLRFTGDIGKGTNVYDVAQLYPGDVSPDDFYASFPLSTKIKFQLLS